MRQVERISLTELTSLSERMYERFVKCVIDIDKEIMVIDADMHVDEEQLLLEGGSKQENLWGINLRPDDYGTDKFVEFDSMINIRPRQNNNSRSVENKVIQKKIHEIVEGIVYE